MYNSVVYNSHHKAIKFDAVISMCNNTEILENDCMSHFFNFFCLGRGTNWNTVGQDTSMLYLSLGCPWFFCLCKKSIWVLKAGSSMLQLHAIPCFGIHYMDQHNAVCCTSNTCKCNERRKLREGRRKKKKLATFQFLY